MAAVPSPAAKREAPSCSAQSAGGARQRLATPPPPHPNHRHSNIPHYDKVAKPNTTKVIELGAAERPRTGVACCCLLLLTALSGRCTSLAVG